MILSLSQTDPAAEIPRGFPARAHAWVPHSCKLCRGSRSPLHLKKTGTDRFVLAATVFKALDRFPRPLFFFLRFEREICGFVEVVGHKA